MKCAKVVAPRLAFAMIAPVRAAADHHAMNPARLCPRAHSAIVRLLHVVDHGNSRVHQLQLKS